MLEKWKDINWYEWLYRVSNFGRVISLYNGNEKSLKLREDCCWYYEAKLFKDKKPRVFRINRLVYFNFKGWDIDNCNPYWKNIVCHLDHNRKNNRLDNLCIWTQKDNISQSYNDWRLTNINKNNLSTKQIIKLRIEMIDMYNTWKYTKKFISEKYWFHATYLGKLLKWDFPISCRIQKPARMNNILQQFSKPL